jgi:hypothetical protein
MSNMLFRRARILFGLGVGTVLIGLTASACGSSSAAASGATSIPARTAGSSPGNVAPATSVPVPTVGAAGTTTQSPHPIPKPVPVLGTAWGTGQKGYGTAHPDTIFNGGDPTGLVTGVHWQSWGGPVAIASGTSYDAHNSTVADSVQRTATVAAFNLGVCHGTLMYQAIEWYFPADGDKFDPHIYIDICTGKYVGSR